MDKLRAAYYGTNTGCRWGYGETYDLIINTDKIGVEGPAGLIKNCLIHQGCPKDTTRAPQALPGGPFFVVCYRSISVMRSTRR